MSFKSGFKPLNAKLKEIDLYLGEFQLTGLKAEYMLQVPLILGCNCLDFFCTFIWFGLVKIKYIIVVCLMCNFEICYWPCLILCLGPIESLFGH